VTAAAIFIVIQQAAESGIRISFLEHAAIGIPVTLLSLSSAGVARSLGRFLTRGI